jgi:hypothetical protein
MDRQDWFCEVCGVDHDGLVCSACGRLLFHFVLASGPVSLIVACAYCDFLDQWASVQADDDAFAAVEMSLALPRRWWWPEILS